MKRHLFVLVPSFSQTGPVKGAIALANALANERQVTLIALKRPAERVPEVAPQVVTRSLANLTTFYDRVRTYSSILEAAGGRGNVASISFCLSADLANVFARRNAVTCSSIRGNLVVNYRMEYGLLGTPAAMGHLAIVRGFDYVVAMTDAMARQVRRYSGRRPAVIGNFVDEAFLDRYRVQSVPHNARFRFLFLGSLTERKQPMLLVEAMEELCRRQIPARMDVVGDGPLRPRLEREVARRDLASVFSFHGHVTNPYNILASADAIVLPSLSEGLARASLEALHLGVPCILRAVEGNAELISPGQNGWLFKRDADLPSVMANTASELRSRRNSPRKGLLPIAFRQHTAARRYLELVESGH